jgi:hypothetical protein
MFRNNLNKSSILFSKNVKNIHFQHQQTKKPEQEKIKIVPKVFQKGSFRRSLNSSTGTPRFPQY